MKLCVLILILGCIPFAVGGCDKKPSGPKGEDNDEYLREQLQGIWSREYNFEPWIFEENLKSDGTVVLKTFRKINDQPVIAGVNTRFHRNFRVELPFDQEYRGTWDVRGGDIYYEFKVIDGNTMRRRYKIERITASEFIRSSQGIDEKTEEIYLRPRAAKPPRTTTASTSATTKSR